MARAKAKKLILKSVEERTALLVEEMRLQISAVPTAKQQTKPRLYEEPEPVKRKIKAHYEKRVRGPSGSRRARG